MSKRTRRFGIAGLIIVVSLGFSAVSSSANDRAAARGTTANCSPPPEHLGLDAYRNVDKLSYLDLESRAASATTADPGGGNDDRAHTLGERDGGALLMDVAGPGEFTFLRMQEDWGGPWKMSVDGRSAVTASAADLGLAAIDATFPFPLSLAPHQSEGSSIIATPFAFGSSFQFSSTSTNGNFYALYRKLPLGGRLPRAGRGGSDVATLLRASPQTISGRGITRTSGSTSIEPGETTIATLTGGPRQIREITFRVPLDEGVSFANQRLRIYWDRESSPSVDAPIKYLAGDGGGVYQPADRPLVRSFFSSAGTDASGFMNFGVQWPMPFHSSARIVLSSRTALPSVAWTAATEAFASPASWWAPFHATYSRVDNPTPGQDLTFLDVNGSGRIVGTVVNFGHTGATLEGDPHFYLDGSRTPQVTLTGTEEWGLGGNYWHLGRQTSLPLGGFPTSDQNPPGTDVDGAALYRYLVADSMPFNASAVVKWEHGGTDNVEQPYRAVVLWYGTPDPTAVRTDELHPGDPAAARAHHLRAPGSSTTNVTGAFTYGVTEDLSTAAGLRTRQPFELTLRVDPRNAGVLLRRQLDTAIPDQRARLSVDGKAAGEWYTAGAYAAAGVDGTPRRFQDDEILLSKRLTHGKRSITLRVVPVASGSTSSEWSMFDLQAMSMVPRCAPTIRTT